MMRVGVVVALLLLVAVAHATVGASVSEVKEKYFIAAVVAQSTRAHPSRIIGGSTATIALHPFAASLLYSWTGNNYAYSCGGTIISTSAVLTAAHCFIQSSVTESQWRIRVGSARATAGGTLHIVSRIILHPDFNQTAFDLDFAILRTLTTINFSNTVAPADIAGSSYVIGDNAPLWAIGWGATRVGGTNSIGLNRVQVPSVSQTECVTRYAERGITVTDNMLCVGWMDFSGNGQCDGDGGSPLLLDGYVVGISSFGWECNSRYFPRVNARVSTAYDWIISNS